MTADIDVQTIVITTALTSTVLAVFAYLKGWLSRGARWVKPRLLRRKPAADHKAIGGGWSGHNAGGGLRYIRVDIKCAPAAALSSPRRLTRKATEEWATAVLGAGSMLDCWLPDEQVRYIRRDPTSPDIEGLALMWPDGLIEAMIPIPHAHNRDGQPTLAVTNIATVIKRFAVTVAAGAHRDLYGSEHRDRNRVDWYIGVGQAISTNQYTPWAELTFPGRPPATRAESARPPWSRAGLAADKLTDIRPDLDPNTVAVNAVKDLIEQSGYPDSDDCLADIEHTIRTTSQP
ncbi:MAG: hypothetical protein JWN62_3873 [Acidimicrobiales bacterium]|nr:hypothetical protein [Acidimicrobiales bacterium]